jgi:hypothetical protein
MSGLRTPLRADHARLLGLALTATGSWLLWSAYEARGRPRPWALKFLPGP